MNDHHKDSSNAPRASLDPLLKDLNKWCQTLGFVRVFLNADTVACEILSVDFVTVSQFSLRVYAQSRSIK